MTLSVHTKLAFGGLVCVFIGVTCYFVYVYRIRRAASIRTQRIGTLLYDHMIENFCWECVFALQEGFAGMSMAIMPLTRQLNNAHFASAAPDCCMPDYVDISSEQ